MKSFVYRPARKIIYAGHEYDSLLELRYAIFIEPSHFFLRAHIPIYFDPSTLQPVNYLRLCSRRYTPDFLIRPKNGGMAEWIELKPRAYEGQPELAVRAQLAETYIHQNGYDWKFRIVYDDELQMTEAQQLVFSSCCASIGFSNYKQRTQSINDRFDPARPRLFRKAPSQSLIRFVMFGK